MHMFQPEIFAQEGQTFLERIRSSSAYELVRHIKVFIVTFTTLEGPPDRYSSYFQKFLDVSNMMVRGFHGKYETVICGRGIHVAVQCPAPTSLV